MAENTPQLGREPGAQARGEAQELGRALVRADAVLRFSLGAAWLGAAAAGPEPLLPLATGLVSSLDLVLAVCGLSSLAGAAPRTTAAAGLAACLLRTPLGAPLLPWIALVGGACARCLLRLGPAGGWLAHLHSLTVAQTIDLLATELRRADASGSPARRESALSRAGDAFERAGRVRHELRALGVDPGASFGAARWLGRGLAALLGPAPRFRRTLARRLDAASRRRVQAGPTAP